METQKRGVFQFPGPRGIVRLIAFKASGDFAFSLDVAAPDYHPSVEELCTRWLDRIDPPVRLTAPLRLFRHFSLFLLGCSAMGSSMGA